MTEELEGFESGRDQLAAVPKVPRERACRDGPRDPDAVEWCFQIAGAQPLGRDTRGDGLGEGESAMADVFGQIGRVPHPEMVIR